MALSVAAAAAKTQAIASAFAGIGVAGDTAMPRSKRNDEAAAYEYFVACDLASRAESRKKKAIKAAVVAGVLIDPEKDPRAPDTHAVIYAGDLVEIMLDVGTPQTRLDAKAFLEDLEKAGLPRRKIDALVAKHTKENRAPHKFSANFLAAR